MLFSHNVSLVSEEFTSSGTRLSQLEGKFAGLIRQGVLQMRLGAGKAVVVIHGVVGAPGVLIVIIKV